MSKLSVKKVIMFKHGVSYFILGGKIKGAFRNIGKIAKNLPVVSVIRYMHNVY